MTIKLRKAKPVSFNTIRLFEDEVGVVLPDSYRNFLLKYNGAKPEPNIFKVDMYNDSGVNSFIPLNQIQKERHFLDKENSYFFPIAWAEGGNYVLIDPRDKGSIHFWDHEEPTVRHKLAEDIDSFISYLKPFDPSQIKLKENQVESAWIDPDFLKNL